jgi:zinc protease
MKNNFLFGLSIILSSTAMQAQPKLIEKVEKKSKSTEVVIPFEKYKLANGLTVLIHEDHSDPIVHVDVTYHVGSAREEIGMSGFAHFFEHMMFQGSKNVADEEHFKIVTQAGGTMNGTTNRDRTNYFETVPKNYLETALWLEADRMGFLLEAVTQKKFEIQRSTVKNEKGQNYENRPYGMVSEVAGRNFYPFQHPYSWLTIGYIEDLNRVGVDDLKKFFLRWYGPNNAVVSVGGDINPKEAIQLVNKYFGSIPRGPEVERAKPVSFTIEKDRYVSYEDNVRFPMLMMQYPTVAGYSEDEPALDILADIIGGGKSSILYQNLVKTKKAVQASASHPCAELAGEFTFRVLAYPTTKLDEMEKLVRASLDEFVTRGIKDDDIKKAVNSHEANMVYGLESVRGKVSQLASYETFTGNANYITKDIERYHKVTKADVLRVFNKYIKGKKGLIMSVYPKGKKDLIAAADNHNPAGDTSKATHMDYSKMVAREVKDDFDRSKKPEPGPSPIITAPKSYTFTMGNGLQGIGVQNNEVPDAYIQFNIKCGQWRQPKGKEGVAVMMVKMLQESTKKRSAEDVSDELDKLGSHLNVGVDEENVTIAVNTLTKNITPTMDLVAEVMTMPKFDPQEFERLKKQHLELLANQKIQPVPMANEAFNKLVYGEGHHMSTSISGTEESITKLTLQDVIDYFIKNFAPNITNAMISGDMTKEQALKALAPLSTWGKREPMEIRTAKSPALEKTKIYLVDKENAPQSEIRIGYLAMPYDATGEYFKAQAMNYILGGAFNSRINLNLREDKGYTYGARSGFGASHTAGPFTASAGVRGDATAPSVFEFMKEIKNYADKGIKPDELEFTKRSILEREALKYETNDQKAHFVERMLEFQLPENFSTKQAEELKALTVNDINALAKKYLPYNNMAIVVVGDAKKNREALEKLGYEVVNMKL